MPTGAVISESMVITPSGPGSGQTDVDFAKCDCCGLTEECTPSYIETIRQRYGGKWICGLCAEAVKEEMLRCQKLISPDEAIARHLSFCNQFRPSDESKDINNPTVDLIRAMRRVLRRSLESPKSSMRMRMMRSMPSSPTNSKNRSGELISTVVLARSESCMPTFTSAEEEEGTTIL
ncbi:uncharacterized protein LOC127262931 [Andrographis paniculata]|uniref:uncharacterized protein LOC127262931 n=1 Tax=Andrographis paniculata TaxID=175694 RepID=UPI0021E9ABDB|nr:uncharacterized protein LOC127262931 [Andrographis paniculata]